MSVSTVANRPVTTVILSRPEVRNAVDRETAAELAAAFRRFDEDPEAMIGMLFGDHGQFCGSWPKGVPQSSRGREDAAEQRIDSCSTKGGLTHALLLPGVWSDLSFR